MYSEKLKDPRWQKKRLEIMSRDDFKCQLCGSDKNTLHVHHKVYNGEPWQAEDEDLVTLCEDCHLMTEKLNGFNLTKAIKSRFAGIEGFYFVAFQNKNIRGIFIVCIDNDRSIERQIITETEYNIVKELMLL